MVAPPVFDTKAIFLGVIHGNAEFLTGLHNGRDKSSLVPSTGSAGPSVSSSPRATALSISWSAYALVIGWPCFEAYAFNASRYS
jgi:hypothetical protein